MKIAVFTESIKKEGGGSQMAVLEYANMLFAKGNEVILFTIGDVDKELEKAIKCELFEIKSLPFVKSIGKGYGETLQKIREFKPEIIHLNELFSSFWIGIRIAKKLGIRSITSFHTLYAKNRGVRNPLLIRISELYTRWMLSFSDELTAPTNYARDFLEKHLKLKKKISLLQYPIVKDEMYIELKELSSKERFLARSGDTLRMVTVSRLAKGKNIDIVLEALLKLKDLPVKFTIIGEGNERDNLEQIIRDRSLADRVFLKGAYPRDKALQAVKEHDVFISASTMETFGITYIEAIMLGVPLICIKQQVTSELLSEFDNVFFAKELGIDSVAKAINSFYKRWKNGDVRFSIDNLEKLEKYTVAKATNRLLEVYKSLTG